MFIATELRDARVVGGVRDELPPEIRRLFRRERQIAEIVYSGGLVTAKDVEVQIGLTNASTRSMLNRLVSKGILTHQRCGRSRTFIYGPALTTASAHESALRQFAEDFCDGSVVVLCNELADLFARSQQLARASCDEQILFPTEIRTLAPRMREIAAVIYRKGIATIGDIQRGVSDELTFSGLRTFLRRMQVRGLVRHRRSGRHREIVYLPAILTAEVRHSALSCCVTERFDASPGTALQYALRLKVTEQTLRRARPQGVNSQTLAA